MLNVGLAWMELGVWFRHVQSAELPNTHLCKTRNRFVFCQLSEDNSEESTPTKKPSLVLVRHILQTVFHPWVHLWQNYNEVFHLIAGYGRFHYTLLALCGWALSSDAIEVLAISFILPPATCDLNMSNSDKGLLNSSVFLGTLSPFCSEA